MILTFFIFILCDKKNARDSVFGPCFVFLVICALVLQSS